MGSKTNKIIMVIIAIIYCKLFICKVLCQGLYLSLLSYSEDNPTGCTVATANSNFILLLISQSPFP